MMKGPEVRELIHAMQDELSVRAGIMLKCAVILTLVLGLARIGVSGEPSAGLGSPAAAAKKTPPKNESYSRRVFEERRQRYIKANPDSHVAREAAALQQKDANSDGGYFAGHSE
ncbi:MAG: hypothetical protein ABI547_06920 [Betaproteobacteria bacterium]